MGVNFQGPASIHELRAIRWILKLFDLFCTVSPSFTDLLILAYCDIERPKTIILGPWTYTHANVPIHTSTNKHAHTQTDTDGHMDKQTDRQRDSGETDSYIHNTVGQEFYRSPRYICCCIMVIHKLFLKFHLFQFNFWLKSHSFQKLKFQLTGNTSGSGRKS